jgi:hypothetical protein
MGLLWVSPVLSVAFPSALQVKDLSEEQISSCNLLLLYTLCRGARGYTYRGIEIELQRIER